MVGVGSGWLEFARFGASIPSNEHVERTPEQEQQHIKRQRIAIVVWAGLLLVILSFVV